MILPQLCYQTQRGPGIVLQPEEGQSYWQPIWANGYSIVKLSPKHAGPDNLAMGIQVIAVARRTQLMRRS
jgi:hypothetical protein